MNEQLHNRLVKAKDVVQAMLQEIIKNAKRNRSDIICNTKYKTSPDRLLN
jgi:hypothetical protein